MSEVKMVADPGQTDKKIQSKLRRWLPVVLLVGLSVLGFATGLHKHVSLSALVENYAALKTYVGDHFVMALLGYVVLYAMATAVSFPAPTLLTVAAGLMFGWVWGAIAIVFAATIGATALYLIARSSFGAALRANAGPRVQKMAQGFADDEVSYMLFLRLVPLFPFTLINIAAGVLNVKFVTYVWTTFVGIIPGTTAYVYAGEGLASVIESQQGMAKIDLSALVTKELIISFAALGFVALIPVVLRRMRAKKA